MMFQCLRVEANFPAERLHLLNHNQGRLFWDEHGGTFVLRVEGLEVVEAPEAAEGAGILLEIALPEPGSLAHRIEEFAGRHELRLSREAAAVVISERPILVACHIPGRQLFIYCEAPQVVMRFPGGQTLEFQISGVFEARRLPCQETDLIIHLEAAAMVRLLSGLLAWTREG
jgi:hypothetical protein